MNSLFIAINNIRRTFREFHAIVFLLIFPILAGLWAVALVSFYDVTKVGINCDIYNNPKLYEVLTSTGKFTLEYYSQDEIISKIHEKKLDIGIIIPECFRNANTAITNENVKILCLENNANVIHVRLVVEELLQSSFLGGSILEDQFLINAKNNIPAQRGTIGFMLMFILLFTGTGMELILEDKKHKTYMRTFCAPVKTYEYILGNLMSNIALGTIQIIFFLLSMELIFNFDWKISLIKVFIILFSFLVCSIGISIGLVGFVKNNRTYSVTNSMLSLFTSFIGGAFFSSSLMGDTLDKVANFFPQKWAMQAYEKLVDGASISNILINFVILFLFGLVFSTFGIRALNPTEDEL